MPDRRLANSRWKTALSLGVLLVCLGLLVHATATSHASRPPSWLLDHLDRVVQRDPSPMSFATRGWFYFQYEQFDRGIADIREAIQHNPGDLGQTYVASSGRELSTEALKHGEEQLRRMLKDRPQMATYIEPDDDLWTWAVRKFAGEDIGKYVYWDSSDPSPFDGDSHPGDAGPATIRVRPYASEFAHRDAEVFAGSSRRSRRCSAREHSTSTST